MATLALIHQKYEHWWPRPTSALLISASARTEATLRARNNSPKHWAKQAPINVNNSVYFKSSRSICRALGQPVNEISIIEINHQRGWVTSTFSLVILGRDTVRNISGTLTFFIFSRFLGRNSSEICLLGWYLVIFRAKQNLIQNLIQ